MMTIGHETVSDLFYQIKWSDGETRHTDAYCGHMVNFWRDLLPNRLKEMLIGKRTGDQLKVDFDPGELFKNGEGTHLVTFNKNQFDPVRINVPGLTPRMGRFYPKGVLKIEYLTNPKAVFAEVARVLRPGGVFVVTYSNRWFPPKAILLWTELQEFERTGLVLEYFRSTELFREHQTYSIRGLMRPRHDKYFGSVPFSDPVYAVWGQRV